MHVSFLSIANFLVIVFVKSERVKVTFTDVKLFEKITENIAFGVWFLGLDEVLGWKTSQSTLSGL